MNKQKLRVVLGDPRHNTIGRHSTYLPVALGYIANYTIASVGSERVNFSLHSDTNELIDTIEEDLPDVIGITNYCWNAELSKMILSHAKKIKPDVVCIGGGAEFPKTPDDVLAYMHYRSELDFYIIQEGEYSFAKLIESIFNDISIEQLKSEPQHGTYSIHPKDGNNVFGPPQQYIEELDSIPSPFLTGILDKFLDGRYVPFLESLRGCPYSCTYCHEGASWRTKVRGFSIKRICAELDYIALKMKNFPDIPLAMADSNFGMYKRDEEIAEHLCNTEKQYHWPRSFIVDTGKSQLGRIISVALKLNKRMSMSISPQSFNKKTLKAIKRKNLGGDKVKEVYAAMKQAGIITNAGIILPLPEETKESFLEGIRILSNSFVESPLPYSAMLLKGTELASNESRKRYGMVTKYRMIPRDFGEYLGNKIFEIEELCVATRTMSYEDYLECRGFMLVFTVYSHHQLNIFKRHIAELDIKPFDFFTRLWGKFRHGDTVISKYYSNYIEETKGETFDSRDELIDFYSRKENYKRLLKGEIGDNLIRKYMPMMLLNYTHELLDIGYDTLIELLGDKTDSKIVLSLRDASSWTKSICFIAPLLRLENGSFKEIALQLNFDVDSWYKITSEKPLVSFDQPVQYIITADKNRIIKSVKTWTDLYGSDIKLWSSRLLEGSVESLWRKCINKKYL